MKKKVLILCTGNSCRSIMAEFLINHVVGDRWIAYSAGVSPSSPNRWALETLSREGIDCSNARSKSVLEFYDRDDLDLVITVCDYAKESCPTFYTPVMQIHIGIEDPIKYAGYDDETALVEFKSCLESIRARILPQLAQFEE